MKPVLRIAAAVVAILALGAVPAYAVKPRNTMQPTIYGTPIVGETLRCEPGGWAGKPSFTYQWVRDDKPIPGATSSTYVLVAEDALPAEEGTPDPQIACVVTGRNSEGVASGKSNSTAVVLVRGAPTGPTPDKIKVTDVVSMPSAKKCVRFRRLSFKTKRPSGVEIIKVTFFVNNKEKRSLPSAKIGSSISLQNLAKTSTVKIQIDVKNSNPVVGSRKYKMCKRN